MTNRFFSFASRLFVISSVVFLLGLTWAAQPTDVPQASAHTYACEGGKTLVATYLNYSDGPNFVVLEWNGQRYGLAEAPSGSGARYAGLYGPTMAGNGLEWWEAQGEATLSTFTDKGTGETRPLLSGCKVQGASG